MKIINELVDNVVAEDNNNNGNNELIVGSINGTTKPKESVNNSNGTSKLFSISQVTPHLYLSGAPAVREDSLTSLGITCVISAAPELPSPPLPPLVSVVLRLPLQDSSSADISAYLHTVADTIQQVSQDGGKVLVHCVAGMSRSAALCLSYLVKHNNMSLRKAFTHLRSCRPFVRPNSGFFRQLIEFEEQVTGNATVSMVHNSAARCVIPDVYEPEYRNTLCYQNNTLNRNFGRH
uniref:Protein-tyrosine-phosphatase n=1 Tax=Clastoptera arizonana TaxID=38151 RepID=A0A1B6EEH0_9HEMI